MVEDDYISIMAVTEYNNPKNFNKIINNVFFGETRPPISAIVGHFSKLY